MWRGGDFVSEDLALVDLLLCVNCRLGEPSEIEWPSLEELAKDCPLTLRLDFECNWKNISCALVGIWSNESVRVWWLLLSRFDFLLFLARFLRFFRVVKQRRNRLRNKTAMGASNREDFSFWWWSFAEQADDTEFGFPDDEPCEYSLDRTPESRTAFLLSVASASFLLRILMRDEALEDR